MNGSNLVPKNWDEVEDWGQREYESGKKAGSEQAKEKYKSWLLNIASDYFKSGKDEEANLLRSIAKELPE